MSEKIFHSIRCKQTMRHTKNYPACSQPYMFAYIQENCLKITTLIGNLPSALYDIYADRKNTNMVPCGQHLRGVVLNDEVFHRKASYVENSCDRVFDREL